MALYVSLKTEGYQGNFHISSLLPLHAPGKWYRMNSVGVHLLACLCFLPILSVWLSVFRQPTCQKIQALSHWSSFIPGLTSTVTATMSLLWASTVSVDFKPHFISSSCLFWDHGVIILFHKWRDQDRGEQINYSGSLGWWRAELKFKHVVFLPPSWKSTVDPRTVWGLGMPALPAVRNLSITLSQPSISMHACGFI